MVEITRQTSPTELSNLASLPAGATLEPDELLVVPEDVVFVFVFVFVDASSPASLKILASGESGESFKIPFKKESQALEQLKSVFLFFLIFLETKRYNKIVME